MYGFVVPQSIVKFFYRIWIVLDAPPIVKQVFIMEVLIVHGL